MVTIESLKSLVLIKLDWVSAGPGGWAESTQPRSVRQQSGAVIPAENKQQKLVPGHFMNTICKAKACLVILGLIRMSVKSMEIFLLGSANSGCSPPKSSAEGSPSNKQIYPSAPF